MFCQIVSVINNTDVTTVAADVYRVGLIHVQRVEELRLNKPPQLLDDSDHSERVEVAILQEIGPDCRQFLRVV
jgi:hypothetical protein